MEVMEDLEASKVSIQGLLQVKAGANVEILAVSSGFEAALSFKNVAFSENPRMLASLNNTS